MTETLEDAYRRLNSELATVIEERDTSQKRLTTLQKEYDSLVIAREAELGVCEVYCEVVAAWRARADSLQEQLEELRYELKAAKGGE